MKIVTWNVNSINARLPLVLNWLEQFNPDVLLLQEIKTISEKFPRAPLEDLGYNVIVNGQKTYNGVAVLSKYPVEDISTELLKGDEQARYLECLIDGDMVVRIVNVYVPNGQDPESPKFEYKIEFLEALYAKFEEVLSYEEIMVAGGDYNIAPEGIDVHDPARMEGKICFHPKEREFYRKFTELGLVDAFRAQHPETQQFSWWDYRARGWEYNRGMRLDHLLISPQAYEILKDSGVDTAPRSQPKPSDHAPVWVKLQ